jgi:hypothetical protein
MRLPDLRPRLVAEVASSVAVVGLAGTLGLEEDVVCLSVSSEIVRYGSPSAVRLT